eukprot:GFUD01000147.1.p1 GENE.GFUD01000147.1~~GFUD01000147.1.p1  ORF type:complete len:199 (+),score=37.94 GFUD01000147.1:61-657(+)
MSKEYTEFEDYPNVDNHLDEDDRTKSATIRWVRVANSTDQALKVKKFIDVAKRQEVQGYQMGAQVAIPIPGLPIDIGAKVKRPSVPLVHNKNSDKDADPTTDDLGPYTCEKILVNGDTDENSKLITLQISKEGDTEPFWNKSVKHKHGVIIIPDPSNTGKLTVIPAAGQFMQSNRWKPHPGCKDPRLSKTYDPKKKSV